MGIYWETRKAGKKSILLDSYLPGFLIEVFIRVILCNPRYLCSMRLVVSDIGGEYALHRG